MADVKGGRYRRTRSGPRGGRMNEAPLPEPVEPAPVAPPPRKRDLWADLERIRKK